MDTAPSATTSTLTVDGGLIYVERLATDILLRWRADNMGQGFIVGNWKEEGVLDHDALTNRLDICRVGSSPVAVVDLEALGPERTLVEVGAPTELANEIRAAIAERWRCQSNMPMPRAGVGRPHGTGTYATASECREAIVDAMVRLLEHGRSISQENVASSLLHQPSVRTLRLWCSPQPEGWGLVWTEMQHEARDRH